MRYFLKITLSIMLSLVLLTALGSCFRTPGGQIESSDSSTTSTSGGKDNADNLSMDTNAAPADEDSQDDGAEGSSLYSGTDATTESFAGEWFLLLEYPAYIEGTVDSIDVNTDSTVALSLNAIRCWNDPDDVDVNSIEYYKKTTDFTLILRKLPPFSISIGDDIVVFETEVRSIDNGEKFMGAIVAYYLSNDKYYDHNGNEVFMPPTDFSIPDGFLNP